MELLIGCLFVVAVIRHVPAAIEDLVVAWRASKSGEWDALDRQHAHRSAQEARRQQRREALARKFTARRDPKGDRRPGVSDLVKDAYHGACEDALEKRRARRADRPLDGSRFDDRVERKLADRVDRPASADPLQRRHCPECGQELVPNGAGWAHAHGQRCPALRPGPEEPPRRRPSPRPRSGDSGPGAKPAVADHVDDERTLRKVADNPDFVDHLFGRPCKNPSCKNPGCTYNTEPQPSTSKGDRPMTTATAEEVHTNEAARRAFTAIGAGARKLAEGAALAEQGRSEMAAAAGAVGDGTAGGGFDAQVTAAANAAMDAAGSVSDATLTVWCEKADAAQAAGDAGVAALEKWRGAEEQVASEKIDPATLSPSQS